MMVWDTPPSHQGSGYPRIASVPSAGLTISGVGDLPAMCLRIWEKIIARPVVNVWSILPAKGRNSTARMAVAWTGGMPIRIR
jgi:NhaP-type Na+/H+ and K+/H+ antiporter